MKINEQTTSFAIHAIMDAYVALPDNGFRLCIEDKAPDWAVSKMAGKVANQTEVRELSEDELPDFVKEALGLAAISDILDIPPQLCGCAIPVETIPDEWTDKYDHIIVFYETIIENASTYDRIKELAEQFVRHEWRHGCQFNWLRQHGLSVTNALVAENETVYGEGPLEADTHRFQRGIEDSLDKAMASFLA